MNRAHGQTLRKATALAWEFCARGWQGVLGPIAALALPGFLFILTHSTDPGQGRGHGIIRSFLEPLPFYWITVLILGSFIFLNLQHPWRRYTLPASSFLLVAVPMACAMLTMFVQYAIVAMILNAAFDAGWAILGPGLLAALLVAWCQAVQWSTSNSLGLPFLVCLSSFVASAFVTVRWTPRNGLKIAEFLPTVSLWQAFGFGLAVLVCVGIGTVGFASLRRGCGIDGRRISHALSERLSFRRAARTTPFSSAANAQFWLEWTRHGYVLPAVIASIGIAAIVLVWSLPATLFDATHIAGQASAILVVPLFVIGFFWGNRSPNFEFGAFNGSRPLSDRQIANAILKSATLGLILSAVIWFACMALVVLIVGGREEISKLYQSSAIEKNRFLVFLVFSALAATAVWSFVGFVTSLSLAGRKVVLYAFALAFGTWMTGALLPLGFEGESQIAFSAFYSTAFAALCLTGCFAAFAAVWHWHLISIRTLCLAATIVLTAVGALYSAGMSFAWDDWPFVVFCCLLPIPLAAAPLAVYVNRHR
jgi:hypothetical protein